MAVDSTRRTALLKHLLDTLNPERALVFVASQHAADHVAAKLNRKDRYATPFHGGLSQGARQEVLAEFKEKRWDVVVTTDLAARGLDIEDMPLVVNYDLPRSADDHVHRIGRTGRAGRNGLAITLAERRDVGMIRRIERFTTQPIAVAVVAGLEPKFTAPSMNGPGFGGGTSGSAGACSPQPARNNAASATRIRS